MLVAAYCLLPAAWCSELKVSNVLDMLWLIPALPLAGFVALGIGRALPRRAAAAIGVGSVAASAIVAVLIGMQFMGSPPEGHACRQVLWQWLDVNGFQSPIAFRLDALSLVMVLVVTGVGFLIHLYSARFMAQEEGYGRFFAYMNLFVASMLILVLADNLLLLYLGWEGVGMCSYLLIGFWYKDPANGRAAMKAFIVTRVGDAAMAVGLFLLFAGLGTLDIQEMMRRASVQWAAGAGNEHLAIAAAALLLAGAVGKSAQLPLQTWLPDAMAGPTPVSALIHAATMVTAGVYLIARTHVIFELAPDVQRLVALVGAVTLLLSGFSALFQHDIKRVLAYSTISQIGYMFLALGVGAYSAAMLHFMTHAFFKALLFLAAGVVILGLHHEHNIFRMGGLRKKMPVTFWTFLIGCLALTSLPPSTAGFSKELILDEVWASPLGGPGLWAAGLAGVFLTSLYTFRMLLVAFFGPAHQEPAGKAGAAMTVPLIVLAGACLVGGLAQWPRALGNWPFFSRFLQTALPAAPDEPLGQTVFAERVLPLVSEAVSAAGLVLAYLLFLRRPKLSRSLAAAPAGAALRRFWLAGWGFDALYDALLVRPFVALARINHADFFDLLYGAIAWINRTFHGLLSRTENGRLRWYAAGLAVGAAAVIAIVVLL